MLSHTKSALQTFVTPLTADAAIDALKTGIESANMRIVAHINGQANAAKIGKEVPADQILEVFRPDFAIKVWNACKPAGLDIPIRIHVYEIDAEVIVACRMPSEVFAPFESAELDEVGKELDAIFDSILSTASGD